MCKSVLDSVILLFPFGVLSVQPWIRCNFGLSVLAGPSCEVVTTCALTVLFPLPEEERGVDLSAPYWRRSVCSPIR